MMCSCDHLFLTGYFPSLMCVAHGSIQNECSPQGHGDSLPQSLHTKSGFLVPKLCISLVSITHYKVKIVDCSKQSKYKNAFQ